MKLKRVAKIRDEYFDNNETLSQQSLDELKQHLEGKDENELCRAISLVTDARLMQFVPLMAKHLNNEDSYVRESLIGKLLGRLKLPEYAEVGLKMAQEDESAGVRSLALFSIGEILKEVEIKLRKKIAEYLLKVFYDEKERNTLRHSAYTSIITDMDVHILDRPSAARDLKIPEEVNWELVEKFKEKYGL
jgi:hypothetical protein